MLHHLASCRALPALIVSLLTLTAALPLPTAPVALTAISAVEPLPMVARVVVPATTATALATATDPVTEPTPVTAVVTATATEPATATATEPVTATATDPATEPTADERPAATVADLAWLAGEWVIEDEGGQFLEEAWSTPEGDALLGTFRWVRDGHLWLYELQSIEEEDGTLVYRLRHFSRNLEPWASERDGVAAYPLVRLTDTEVVFENPEVNDPRRFIYRLEGDTLSVILEKVDEQGEVSGRDAFPFTRAE